MIKRNSNEGKFLGKGVLMKSNSDEVEFEKVES